MINRLLGSGFNGIAQFVYLKKMVSGRAKVVFTNCVFEKLRSFETLLYSVFSKAQQLQYKLFMLKNRKFMNNHGWISNLAKNVFFVWCSVTCF